MFWGESDISQDDYEMSIDEEDIKEVIDNVRNNRNVSSLDLEQVVMEGKERKLVKSLEDAVKDDELKNLSREDKVTMMSNSQKIVALENLSEEYEDRAMAVGMILLTELATEDWRKISGAEANLFKRIISHTTMTDWVRAVLWGLLTSAEEAAGEEDRKAGEQDAELETVSKKLDGVVKKILVNPPDLSRKAALEKCEAKINIIEKQLNVSKVVGDLQKSVQQLRRSAVWRRSPPYPRMRRSLRRR